MALDSNWPFQHEIISIEIPRAPLKPPVRVEASVCYERQFKTAPESIIEAWPLPT